MNPATTVVIPAFNTGRYLRSALDSVFAQSPGRDLEVLVVDDGSTDDTRVIARADGRVRLLEQSHAGVAAARNVGVREAKAPLVAFLDGDDLWHRDHLQALGEAMAREPAALGAASGTELMTADGTATGQRWIFGSSGEDLARAACKGCPVLISATVVRREALLLEPFDESMSTGSDWDFWVRLLQRGPLALVGRPTALYRRHAGAISMDRAAREQNRQRMAAKHQAAPWGPVLTAYLALHDARECLATGRPDEAEASLARAGRLYPEITADLQWWPFFESFRSHDRPDWISGHRFWLALHSMAQVCSSPGLPFRAGERRRAFGSGLAAAAYYARLSRLWPELALLPALARVVSLRARPASPSGSDTGPGAR